MAEPGTRDEEYTVCATARVRMTVAGGWMRLGKGTVYRMRQGAGPVRIDSRYSITRNNTLGDWLCAARQERARERLAGGACAQTQREEGGRVLIV